MADVLDVAFSHLGEHGNAFWNYCGNYNEAWCAAYISTVLAEAGEGAAISNKKMTSVSQYLNYFQQQNAYHTKGSGYTPQPGDIVIMKTGVGAMGSHVALVSKVYPDGSFDTIEGNRGGHGATGNTVITDHYDGTEDYISGYGVPRYISPPVGGGNYSSIGGGTLDPGYTEGGTGGISSGVGLYDFGEDTVRPGDTWQAIADRNHVSLATLLAYNKADVWSNPEPGSTVKIPHSQWTLGEDGASAGNEAVEKAHTKSVKVYHPVIKAEFYAESGQLSAVSDATEDKVWGDRDLDFDIISCNTQRSLGADCASMTITLTNRRDWYTILSSNDLVIVRMQRPEFGTDAAELHEEEQEVFIGVIDDVRKSLDFSSGQPRRAVQVTARGMGKAFVNFDVGLIENITINQSTGFMKDLMSMSGMNSSEAIRTIWSNFVGRGIQYQFYRGCLTDYIAYDGSHPREEEKLLDNISYTQYSGSLWNFIKELSNLPFNETFWEIRNGKAVLFHRKTPFNPEDWSALNRRTLYDDDIVTDATGRSDLETYTVYIVNMRFATAGTKHLFNPLWYYPFYCKYGLSQLEVTSVYENQGGNLAEAMKTYSTDLFNWNILNNKFANGQIVVKGRASYKIGEVIVLEYCNLEFYVEGVSHNFTVYGGWTTTLSVTRGIEPERRFIPPWGEAQEMTSDAMSKIVEITGGADVDMSEISLGDPDGFDLPGSSVSGGSGPGLTGSFGGSSSGTNVGTIGAAGVPEVGLGPQNNATPGDHKVPDSFKQSGIISDYTYGIRDWGSNSRKIYNKWIEAGKPHDGPLMTLNGRYLVATVIPEGYNITVVLEDNTRIPCTTLDVKGSDRYNVGSGTGADWGHKFDGGYSLVEWEACQNNQAAIIAQLKGHNWYGKKVTNIIVEGPA